MVIFSWIGCGTSKYFQDGSQLLTKYDVKYKGDENVLSDKEIRDIDNYILQKPNGNFLGIPKEYIYLKNSEEGDSSWYNKWLRGIGEPPAVYDSTLTEKSVLGIGNYLRNLKGFYNAEVDYLEKPNSYKMGVDYIIAPKDRYHIGSVSYRSTDKNIVKEIDRLRGTSYLVNQGPIDFETFEIEKNRIALALQNKGYVNFSPNYIETFGVKNDTTHNVDIYFNVNVPSQDSLHRKFKVGQICIYTDGDANALEYDTLILGYKKFLKRTDKFVVKPRVLDQNIALITGNNASRIAKLNTIKYLYQLPTFRFVSITEHIDEKFPNIINYDIILNPHKSRWLADFGLNSYFSSVNTSSLGRRFVGFSISTQLQNRNLFGGGELYTMNAETGFEYEINPFSRRTFNVSLQNQVRIADYKDYMGLLRLINTVGLIDDKDEENFRNNAVTNISLGFRYTDIKDGYIISAYNGGISVKFDSNGERSYAFSHLGFNLNNSVLTDRFKENIDNNPLIIKSLSPNLITGLILKDFGFTYKEPNPNYGGSWAIYLNYEISGLELYLANKVFSPDRNWVFANQYEFSKYNKLEFDIRRYQFFNKKKQSLATRFHAGVIVPYGGSEAAPFIKQFSVGGPNSLRGWLNQELGPGGNTTTINSANSIFFQKGDIVLEFNAEYRFDLFWLLEGALFYDTGNIWTLKVDERNDANFTSHFLKQMALDVGWGIRLDIEYFNIRFDFGYKLRRPYPDDSGKYFNSLGTMFENIFGTPQIAINYPF
ncbi:MAG: BamA/TamA family outer membrane protein [Saprospiraceae bacterium]